MVIYGLVPFRTPRAAAKPTTALFLNRRRPVLLTASNFAGEGIIWLNVENIRIAISGDDDV